MQSCIHAPVKPGSPFRSPPPQLHVMIGGWGGGFYLNIGENLFGYVALKLNCPIRI